MTPDITTLPDQLRQWGSGMTTLTAATELLIQSGRAKNTSTPMNVQSRDEHYRISEALSVRLV